MAHKRPRDNSDGRNDDSEEKRQHISLARFVFAVNKIFTYFTQRNHCKNLVSVFYIVSHATLFYSSSLDSTKSTTMQMFLVLLEPMIRRVVQFQSLHFSGIFKTNLL